MHIKGSLSSSGYDGAKATSVDPFLSPQYYLELIQNLNLWLLFFENVCYRNVIFFISEIIILARQEDIEG